MPPYYKYELWDGKQVIGYFSSQVKLFGKELRLPEVHIFKQSYFKKPKYVTIPIITRVVSSDGIDTHFRVVLDVRRKSRRQIEIIQKA